MNSNVRAAIGQALNLANHYAIAQGKAEDEDFIWKHFLRYLKMVQKAQKYGEINE